MKRSNQSVSKWCLVSMASIPLVMTLGNSMLIPALPLIEKQLRISAFKSSLLITCYSIASILLIPIAGFLSDKYGRKKIILPSLAIVMIGGIISGIAASKMENPYWMIIFGRILQGIGASGAAPIVLPLIGDLYKNDDDASSALGIIETSNTFGKVLSPILGAVFASIIWYLPFYLISLFSLISFFLICIFVKTPKKKTTSIPMKKFLANAKKIFHKEGRWLYTLFIVGGFVMFILFSLQVFLSSHLETEFHLKGVKKGLVLAIPLLFLCISSLVSGKIIKGNKQLMKKIIIVGLLLQAITLTFFKEYDSLFLLLTIISLNGIAIGSILPTLDALITENIEKPQRGLITSFYSSARFIGVAAGPPFMSMLIKKDLTIATYSAAIITLYLTWLVIRKIQVNE